MTLAADNISMSGRSFATAVVCALTILASVASEAAAQGFISPFVQSNFGGDAGCVRPMDCEHDAFGYGVGLGVMGNVLGFEEEVSYTPEFFGNIPGVTSSVLTLTSNLLVIPNIGPIRPYGEIGVGLIRSHLATTPVTLIQSDTNNFGWDVGGGLMIALAPHVGVRGDLRYFKSLQDWSLVGITLSGQQLDFGRITGALVVKF
jgi:opacity protein-like surface antigen